MKGQSGDVDAWGDDPLVVVGVDADRIGLEVEGVLAVLDLLQLVLVEVRPAPNPSVNHVREALATCQEENICYGKAILKKTDLFLAQTWCHLLWHIGGLIPLHAT